MDPLALAALAVNVLVLATGFVALVRWFRRWLVKQVSEPVQTLTDKISQTHDLAQRAHDRLDRHLEAHSG